MVKLGFITKFPVDFFFVLEDAAKAWDAAHPEAEVIFGQGESATDDEGEIALIESMVAQGVKGIAITPTSEAVVPALDKAIEQGVKVVLMDNDIPSWDGKSAVVATDNKAGGVLAGQWLAGVAEGRRHDRACCEGAPGVPALDDRVNGMMEGLGDLDVEVVGKARRTAPRTRASPRRRISSRRIPTSRRSTAPAARRRRARCRRSTTPASSPRTSCWSASTPRRTRSPTSRPARRTRRSRSTRRRSASSASTRCWKVVSGETCRPFVDTGTAIVTAENAADFE